MRFEIEEKIKEAAPEFKGIAVLADVVNSNYKEELWKLITNFTEELKQQLTVSQIKELPPIAATREVYKKCGKEPNRYRPSSEALRRRVLRGMDLYQINTLVDITNLISLVTGYSIGGFDSDKLEGDKLVLGVGRANEPYEGIGRGTLNIENLPVYRDSIGGVGTPTSDHERSKITLETTHLLILINGYDGDDFRLNSSVDYTKQLLLTFTEAKNIREIHF